MPRQISILPYCLCKELLESLIYYVTRRINMEPSSLNGYGPMPYGTHAVVEERWPIRWLTIKASFGVEYCQADANSEDNNMEPRASGAITLYEASDTYEKSGCFIWNRDELPRDTSLLLLPMPDIMIKFLNDRQDKDCDTEDMVQGGEPWILVFQET